MSTGEIVLGGLVGGLGSQLLTFASRRMDFRREDHARYMADRREAYVQVIRLVNATLTASMRVQLYAGREPDEFRKQQESVGSAVFELDGPVETLRLLAPALVVDALVDVANRAFNVLTYSGIYKPSVEGQPFAPDDQLSAAIDALRIDLDEFVRRARQDLGLAPVPLTTSMLARFRSSTGKRTVEWW